MDGILAKGEKCQEFLDRSCLVGEQPTKGSTAAMHKNIFKTEVKFKVKMGIENGQLGSISDEVNANLIFTMNPAALCQWLR